MALHNFLSTVALNNFFLRVISPKPCSVLHLLNPTQYKNFERSMTGEISLESMKIGVA